MSADDPNDDELEREAARDVPAHITNPRHAPKLSQESRAINPRATLEAERAGQSIPDRGTDGYTSSRRNDVLRDMPDIREEMDRRLRNTWEPRPAPSHVAGQLLGLVRPPPPREPERAEPTHAERARAWDRYVAAALPVAVALGYDDIVAGAKEIADHLLAARRTRFE